MEDLRTKRTHKLLKDSLFSLLSKKSFDEVKVIDICELAMVHRATFYSHFADKYELLEYCIKEVEKEIICNLRPTTYSDRKEFYTNMIMSVLDYLNSNKKFFRAILKKNEDTGFIKIFNHTCISYIHDMLLKEEESGISHNIPIEVIVEFYSGAVISTITWWLKSNSKLSKEELCTDIVNLIFENPHA